MPGACRNPRLERRFQNSWAARKVAHDKAVLIFLIIVTLGVEIADIAYGHAPQVGQTALLSALSINTADVETNRRVAASCNCRNRSRAHNAELPGLVPSHVGRTAIESDSLWDSSSPLLQTMQSPARKQKGSTMKMSGSRT